MINQYQLILASQSPRRQQLLKQLGYQFTIEVADVDESRRANESAKNYVERVTLAKAEVIANKHTNETILVLAADTAVVIDGEILGKPQNQADAGRMLKLLSGNRHHVYTCIGLIDAMQPTKPILQTVVSDVFFKPLTDEEITQYWLSGEPQDKAGSYAIQGIAGAFISRIEGSYSAIVGLPLLETNQLLSGFPLARKHMNEWEL